VNAVVDRNAPWWKRWFIEPVFKQLTQGISPERLAWTIAVGCALGIFPIMGSTSLACFAAAAFWGLNQPVIQVVCHALWPAHLALILPFIKLGQWVHGANPITRSISELLKEFFASPWQFAQDYWLAAWHGVVAWAIVAVPLIFIVRALTLPILKSAAGRIAERKEATT